MFLTRFKIRLWLKQFYLNDDMRGVIFMLLLEKCHYLCKTSKPDNIFEYTFLIKRRWCESRWMGQTALHRSSRASWGWEVWGGCMFLSTVLPPSRGRHPTLASFLNNRFSDADVYQPIPLTCHCRLLASVTLLYMTNTPWPIRHLQG